MVALTFAWRDHPADEAARRNGRRAGKEAKGTRMSECLILIYGAAAAAPLFLGGVLIWSGLARYPAHLATETQIVLRRAGWRTTDDVSPAINHAPALNAESRDAA